MTLVASGNPISMSQVNTELGLTSTASISLNDTDPRTLAGKASGTISMSDFYSKTWHHASGQVTAGPLVASVYSGSSYTLSLANATDGDEGTYVLLNSHCTNSSTAGSGTYTTTAKTCYGTRAAGLITWSGTLTTSSASYGQAYVRVHYSLDGGATWVYNALVKTASWGNTTNTIFSGVSVTDPSLIRIRIITTGDVPSGYQSYSDATVYLYEVNLVLT